MEKRDLRVSQQVLEWRNEGKLEGLRENVLRLFTKRCKAPVPDDLVKLIIETKDVDLLLNWLDAAIMVDTFDQFRPALKS